jgi:hypothetical protein
MPLLPAIFRAGDFSAVWTSLQKGSSSQTSYSGRSSIYLAISAMRWKRLLLEYCGFGKKIGKKKFCALLPVSETDGSIPPRIVKEIKGLGLTLPFLPTTPKNSRLCSSHSYMSHK